MGANFSVQSIPLSTIRPPNMTILTSNSRDVEKDATFARKVFIGMNYKIFLMWLGRPNTCGDGQNETIPGQNDGTKKHGEWVVSCQWGKKNFLEKLHVFDPNHIQTF